MSKEYRFNMIIVGKYYKINFFIEIMFPPFFEIPSPNFICLQNYEF